MRCATHTSSAGWTPSPTCVADERTAHALDPSMADSGFADVGFRLAYTAPIDSIGDVLAAVFRAPPYLPGGSAK